MKKIQITMLCMLLVFIAFSQSKNNPPANVRESFQKEYPQSKSSEWVHSSAGWSVNFEDKDHNYGEVTANFDNKGNHLETDIPFDNKDVPAPVIQNVKSKYPKTPDYDVTRIDRSGENSVYKVNLKDKNSNHTIYLDEKGQKKDYSAKR
jgi:hypothetical protein